MRETLYFKDDDARLSFLQGNYVTLTNLNDSDIRRIIDMRLNINVSVHTTNPELRCKMMNNRFAGEKLKYIKMMADSGLMLNCQIVCCPEINDGAELKRTLEDLYALMPNIQSVAVVPVGITKFRRGLYPLKTFDKASAADVIDLIDGIQRKSLEKYGTRMVFAADEFYLTAERPLPNGDFYEDYPQYENGVGLCRSLIDEVDSALQDAQYSGKNRRVTVACGVAAYPVHVELAEKIMKKFPDIDINVKKIVNHFFGETITVTGLITAGDLSAQLKDENIGEELLISKSMLKADEPIFLDDKSLDDVSTALNVKITPTANDGYEYLEHILGD
jgi:putative radical SAM enzyme (TIGR03279 family)